MDLFGARVFYIHKALKIFVVCKYENFMFTAFQVVFSTFECFNNCQ